MAEDATHRRTQLVIDGMLRPVGYEQITSLAAAQSLTLPAVGNARAVYALIECESQAVRWRDDGTNPTAAVGMPLPVDTPFWYNGDLATFKVIEQTPSAKVNVCYYA